ncbi:uncharacterized protein TNCV_275031 [Trichonephila clavipes]|nr:uncharacterized protein TNCV_275031 [Trichonephila clavipes]
MRNKLMFSIMQKAASELLVLHPTKENKIVEYVAFQLVELCAWRRERFLKCLEALSRNLCSRSRDAASGFQGSALKMEAVGATRIFQRSIVKRGLKYAHYYGDGDSKGFISVKDTYGKDSVTKYECIGHVQKRVGARLRKLKSKNKNLSGKGKLTDSFIDRLQNYYGIAVL